MEHKSCLPHLSVKSILLAVVATLLSLVFFSPLQQETAKAETTNIVKAPYETYLTVPGAKIQFASPAVGDLDHDDYLEIVVGTADGWIHAIKPDSEDGTLLWSFQTKDALNRVAVNSSKTTIRGTPAIADLDGDGWNEVIVPIGTVPEERENGGLVVLTHDGKLVEGWPQLTFDRRASGYTAGIANAPAVADLDNDGDKEIVVGAFDHRLYAWHHDGTWVDGWPQHVYDTVWSSPALGDLDADGLLEIVVGVDAHLDPYQGSIDGGALYVFRIDGTVMEKFPIYINEILASSPALADLNQDGYLDIIVGGGSYYDGSDGYKVHAWDRFGRYLPGWPASTGGSVTGSPAVADLDGNGDLEVVVGSWDKKIYAWHHNGQGVSGWPLTPRCWNGSMFTQRTVVVADSNSKSSDDSRLEILTPIGWEIVIADNNGNQLTWDGVVGNPQSKPTYYTSYTLDAPPAVADVDGDDRLELVAGGAASGGAQGAIYVWELPDSRASQQKMDWPFLKRDVSRRGHLEKPKANDAVVVRHNIPDHLSPGETADIEIVVRNLGTETWTTEELHGLGGDELGFDAPSRLALPSSVAPGSDVTFRMRIQAPAAEGFYDLNWGMVRDGVGSFGARIIRRVKVGNQPAMHILFSSDTQDSVIPVGLADPISSPNGYNFSNAQAFALTQDGKGYYVLDGPGGYVLPGGSAEDVGSAGTKPAVDLVLSADGEAYYVIDAYGHLSRPSSAVNISPLPPTFEDARVRSLATTLDGRGMYVLDKYGRIYTGGTAATMSPSIPVFSEDIAIKIKLTADGKGYYVLDRYGRVHNGGNAPAISPNYTPHIGEDWARDFELTEDGRGYYMIDKDGHLYTGGSAVSVPFDTAAVSGAGQAVDLEIYDSRALAEPYLAVDVPQTLHVMTAPDEPSPMFNLLIENGGVGGSLRWTAEIVSGGDWISLSSTSGTTPADVDLRINTPKSTGNYTGYVLLSAKDDSGRVISTYELSVSLLVVHNLHKVHMPLSLR